jgi:hypothetical protein
MIPYHTIPPYDTTRNLAASMYQSGYVFECTHTIPKLANNDDQHHSKLAGHINLTTSNIFNELTMHPHAHNIFAWHLEIVGQRFMMMAGSAGPRYGAISTKIGNLSLST